VCFVVEQETLSTAVDPELKEDLGVDMVEEDIL
jgi:hypothetical protein